MGKIGELRKEIADIIGITIPHVATGIEYKILEIVKEDGYTRQ